MIKCLIVSFLITLGTAYLSAQSLVGKPDGFAQVGAVTGGAGGQTVSPTSTAEFDKYLDNDEPLIVVIRSTIDLGGKMHTLRSNKTIIGDGTKGKIINGGLESGKQYENVIIQNIEFIHSPDDLIKLYGAKRFWVDHCTFSDGPSMDVSVDGLFDISNAANHITISYCKFFNHSKNILIGAKDGNSADAVTRVTLHHNWFKGTEQRNPRVRYASVHCYNNYYESNSIYAIVSACNAKVVVENCYFKNVKYPIFVGYDESPAGMVNSVNNIFSGCGEPVISNGMSGKKGQSVTNFAHDWTPAKDYTYSALPPQDVPAHVMAQAGIFGGGTGVRRQEARLENTDIYMPSIQEYGYNSFKISGALSVSLFDISGKKIRTVFERATHPYPGESILISLNDLNSGTYYLMAQSGVHTISKKVTHCQEMVLPGYSSSTYSK